jgi:hypothetical protein
LTAGLASSLSTRWPHAEGPSILKDEPKYLHICSAERTLGRWTTRTARVGDRVTDVKDTTVLVVIGDETQRQLVGWIVAEMNLPARLVPNWRAALVSTTGAPSCIIADLDDAGDNTAGAAVLSKSWGGTVPLIVLSRQPDIAERATRVGAVAGLRKPLNVGALMGIVERSVTRFD